MDDTTKNMIEQYLCDYFDLIIVISESMNISVYDTLNIKEIEEITPSIIRDIDNNVIAKLLEMYSNSTSFSIYETVKIIEGLDKETALERLKDNELSYFIIDNASLKN